MSSNNIVDFPADYFRPENIYQLEVADLAENQLKSFPVTLRNMTSLRKLNLNKNDISLDDIGQFENLQRLTDLGLSANQISVLKNGVFKGLVSLRRLDLSDNRITVIEEDCLSSIQLIVSLDLNGNLLRSVNGAFKKNSLIRLLRLARNKIARLYNDTFDGLQSMSNLYLAHNQIHTIDSGCFSSLTSLKIISLMKNGITSLPSGVFMGTRCSLLDLQLNGLSDEENLVNALDGLQMTLTQILLSYNHFTKLSNNFCSQFNVNNLALNKNNIKVFPNITLCRSLKKIDLRGSMVSTIYKCQMEGLVTDVKCELCPIQCDCNMRWMLNGNYTNSIKSTSPFRSLTCLHPPNLRGRNLVDLSSKDLKCSDGQIPLSCPRNAPDRKVDLLLDVTSSPGRQNKVVTTVMWSINATHPISVDSIILQVEDVVSQKNVITQALTSGSSNYTLNKLVHNTRYNICVTVLDEQVIAKKCMLLQTRKSPPRLTDTTQQGVVTTISANESVIETGKHADKLHNRRQDTVIAISCITIICICTLLFLIRFFYRRRCQRSSDDNFQILPETNSESTHGIDNPNLTHDNYLGDQHQTVLSPDLVKFETEESKC